jgi:hypothetical protein
MRAVALIVALLAVLASGCGGSTAETVTVTVGEKTGIGAPPVQVLFGHVKTMSRRGDGYELRFDPAWFLSGETASRAAVEDGVLDPGQPVPNDNYRVEEGHRLLTYLVPKNARVTVLRDGAQSAEITADELAQLVAGKSPFGKPLFEPISTGFWLRAKVDTVRSLDQQYQP